MGTQTILADPEIGLLDDVVDTERYPIHEPDSVACKDMIADIRNSLVTDGGEMAEHGCHRDTTGTNTEEVEVA